MIGITKRVLKRMFNDHRMSLLIDWISKGVDDTSWRFGEVLTGVVDGNNKIFTSEKTPIDTANVALFLAYSFPLKPTDFTIDGNTWTLAEDIDAPADGESLIAFYKYSKSEL
nr:hypothetical protein [uncultured Draconibacterium sp.]